MEEKEIQEKIKLISRNLVNKALEKFDKCNWKKGDDVYILSFGINGSIRLKMDHLFIYDLRGNMIMEYSPTVEEMDAYNMAVLYGKILTKHKEKTNEAIQKIITELDNLK